MDSITRQRINDIKEYLSNPDNPDREGARRGLEDWVLQQFVEEGYVDLEKDMLEPLLQRRQHDDTGH